MGRTGRIRNRKCPRNFRTCNNVKQAVLLNSWLAKQGLKCNKQLVLALFDNTGRGVLTKKKIHEGEELMSLPLNLTINIFTILDDSIFCAIFLQNKYQCLQEQHGIVSFQSLMAFYLLFLKVQDDKSKWFVYLESLPTEYSLPYFLPAEVQCYLNQEIIDVISKQKHVIDKSFHIFKKVLINSMCSDDAVRKLKDTFSLRCYEWAYFTVNTRCIFMDLTKVINFKAIPNTILGIVSDNATLSLCPYLDMINHNPNAKNETKLLIQNHISDVCGEKIYKDLCSHVRFSIYTKNKFDPYTQVFICYGDSHNLKLITEYGFHLPNNELDYVSFHYETVKKYLYSNSMKLSKDQESFVVCHNLDKNLYIDCRGLSFNFYALLMVVKYFYDDSVDVSNLIYSAAICSNNKLLNDLIKPMITKKLEKIKASVQKLSRYGTGCIIINNCVALMSHYIDILEKFGN